MKVGSFVFATDQGLGYLAKAFYDHGVVTDVMVIRHGRRPEHDEWYPHARRVSNLRDPAQVREMERFCSGMDVMLFFETPFCWSTLEHCGAVGVRTVLIPMHECMPDQLPAVPDLFLCPSELDFEWALRPAYNRVAAKHLPVPVEEPWHRRGRATHFVHNAGHGGLLGRNGTAEVIEALKHVRNPIQFTLRSQDRVPKLERRLTELPPHIDVRFECGTRPREDLYRADAFVFPEKFNGLSLPLQEAYASGMLVIATDRFPVNRWLPTGGLVVPAGYRRQRVSPRCCEFDEAIVDPRGIAAMIDEWYGKDLTAYSGGGRQWAEVNSWDVLKPRYLEVLRG